MCRFTSLKGNLEFVCCEHTLAPEPGTPSPGLSPLLFCSCWHHLRTEYPVQTLVMELHSGGCRELGIPLCGEGNKVIIAVFAL